jgi:hypothetical protein
MVRDPRDVIVSRHFKDKDKYWTNLRLWKNRRQAVKKIAAHPRFLTIRYEDLVSNPAKTQETIMKWAHFLNKKACFNDFHQLANPSKKSLNALRGVRPITAENIGVWRRHKPRIAAQIALHGSISEDLIELGYEPDGKWVSELEGIEPDNGISYWPENVFFLKTIMQSVIRHIKIIRYAIGIKPKGPTLQK